MAEELQSLEPRKRARERRSVLKKGSKAKKKQKVFQSGGEKLKMDRKMKKLLRQKARDYDSDNDDESSLVNINENEHLQDERGVDAEIPTDEEGEDPGNAGEENEASEDEEGEIQPGITKFAEGCKAFRMAFRKLTKNYVSDDVLGPVLSAHKKLLAAKLAEEEAERKVKGKAKKEKRLVEEKGHVKPAQFLVSHEKFLVRVATKGVVKLFNAVNKAQSAQRGLDPSRSKDAKEINKRRKDAFFSELGKTSSQSTDKAHTSIAQANGDGPAWAPLRDNYMLTSSKLKDWDKMPDTSTVGDEIETGADTSSDDE